MAALESVCMEKRKIGVQIISSSPKAAQPAWASQLCITQAKSRWNISCQINLLLCLRSEDEAFSVQLSESLQAVFYIAYLVNCTVVRKCGFQKYRDLQNLIITDGSDPCLAVYGHVD